MKTTDIPGWYDWHEFYEKVAKEAPTRGILVEVGVFFGKSLIDLILSARDAGRTDLDFYGVDNFSDYPDDEEVRKVLMQSGRSMRDVLEENLVRYEVSDDVEIVEDDSRLASEIFDDESVFMVFLDADHQAESVERDIASWLPKVMGGGWIAGHDATYDGVRTAVAAKLNGVVFEGSIWRLKKE